MNKPLDAIDRLLSLLLIAGGFAIFVFVMGNVITRYVWDLSVAWVNEITEMLSVWLAFLGGAKAVRMHVHLGISELVDTLGPKLKHISHLVALVIVSIILVIMIVAGIKLTRAGFEQNFSVTQWPVGWMYAALPIGSILALIFTIEDFWKSITGQAPDRDLTTVETI